MKRWLVRICVFLLLLGGGAIVNVAIAWGTAGWLPLRSDGNVLELTPVAASEVALWKRWVPEGMSSGPVVSSWTANWGAHVLCIGASRIPDDTTIYSNDEGRVISMRLENMQGRPEVEQFDHALFVRSGWPYAAMFGARWQREADSRNLATSAQKLLLYKPKGYSTTLVSAKTFALRTRSQLNRATVVEHRVIPLAPIWPGFAINTVFYAVILWLLFAGPFVLRRRRRIRRGLCPKCAYDLRGTPPDATACPECGATSK